MKGEERMMGCSKLIDLAMTGSPSAIVNSHDHVETTINTSFAVSLLPGEDSKTTFSNLTIKETIS